MMEMYQQGIVILTIIQQLQQTPTSFLIHPHTAP
jgi:hypothetical protein